MSVATDIGGTFTDLVHLDEETNEIGLARAATTPPQFEHDVLAALVATKGFRDVLDITRSNWPGIYDVRFRKPDGSPSRRLGIFSRVPVSKGDVVRILTGTAGGWGDPGECEPKLEAVDLREGFVTVAEAEATYVGVLDPEPFAVRAFTVARQGAIR